MWMIPAGGVHDEVSFIFRHVSKHQQLAEIIRTQKDLSLSSGVLPLAAYRVGYEERIIGVVALICDTAP